MIHAELHRIVLDEVHMREKREEEPDPAAPELTPELWAIFRERRCDIDGQGPPAARHDRRVLADARITGDGDFSVAWTLTGVPPEGGTLAQELTRLGVTPHERWPTSWR